MIDIRAMRQRIDLTELAGRYSQLRRISAHEMAGPCPLCGGEDRFHVKADGWFCRQCHPKWGDAIDFVRWMNLGLGFREAVAMLSGGTVPDSPNPPRQPVKRPHRPQTADWAANAERLVEQAHERLWQSEEAIAYLEGRGLQSHVWLMYGLGFTPEAPTAERAPAIVMPWYRAGKLRAVRFRYLRPGDGPKVKALAGSQFAGMFFGGRVLPDWVSLPLDEAGRNVEKTCTLVLVEGEINAMSVWQIAQETRLHVLSLGSESARLTDKMVNFANRYGRILVWADRAEVARKQALALVNACAVQSPNGKDANDLLISGDLGGFLTAVRLKACRTDNEREELFWDLWDAAHQWHGIDTGTAQMASHIAKIVGESIMHIPTKM